MNSQQKGPTTMITGNQNVYNGHDNGKHRNSLSPMKITDQNKQNTYTSHARVSPGSAEGLRGSDRKGEDTTAGKVDGIGR